MLQAYHAPTRFVDAIKQIVKTCDADLSRPFYLKLVHPTITPLTIENFESKELSIAHYYEQEGYLMRDPEVVFYVEGVDRWVPTEFLQDNLGLAQCLVENPKEENMRYNSIQMRGIRDFLNTWATNLVAQFLSFGKVRDNIEIILKFNDEDEADNEDLFSQVIALDEWDEIEWEEVKTDDDNEMEEEAAAFENLIEAIARTIKPAFGDNSEMVAACIVNQVYDDFIEDGKINQNFIQLALAEPKTTLSPRLFLDTDCIEQEKGSCRLVKLLQVSETSGEYAWCYLLQEQIPLFNGRYSIWETIEEYSDEAEAKAEFDETIERIDELEESYIEEESEPSDPYDRLVDSIAKQVARRVVEMANANS